MTPADPLVGARWKNASNQNGSCVDLALPASGLAVRDSKNPDGDCLLFGRSQLATLLAAVKSGRFDG
jgi:uncharacterized protein DUF397